MAVVTGVVAVEVAPIRCSIGTVDVRSAYVHPRAGYLNVTRGWSLQNGVNVQFYVLESLVHMYAFQVWFSNSSRSAMSWLYVQPLVLRN